MFQFSRLRARWACTIALLAVSLLPAAAAHADEPSPSAIGLAQFLDADGTLRLPEHFSGTLDPQGFRLASLPGEAPRFSPTAKNLAVTGARWSDEFSLAGCGDILAMAVGEAGELYLGGHFSSCGGVAANHVVRYDPGTDAWSALGSGDGNGVGANGIGGTVYALAVFDGDVYVGGDFNIANMGGVEVRANNIARWTGSEWLAVASASGSDYGAGTNSRVETLAVWNGDLYVGGFFREVNSGGGGFAWTVSASRIARWDGSTWHALGGGVGDNAGGWVRAIVEFDGALYVGGAFDVVNGSLPAKNLGRWDGSAWSTVGSGAGNGVSSASGNYDLFGGVYALAEWNGDLYVGGNFARANVGEPVAASHIARWDGAAWHALSALAGSGAGGIVEALVAADDGLYAGGRFTSVNGAVMRAADRIARWDGNDWSVLGSPSSNGVDNSVMALAELDGVVYVGGHLDRTREAVPQRTRGIAAWDGQWSVPGGGDGQGLDGEVRAVAMFQGDLYVGGAFTMAGGVAANRIVRWDGSQWSAVGSGAGNGVAGGAAQVRAMIVHDGALYVGGAFNAINVGASSPARNLARWDGAQWSSVGNGVDNFVLAFASSGGDLYVGGSFVTVNADAPPAERVAVNRIARWDGAAWSALGSGGGNGVYGDANFAGQVNAIALFQDAVYVGGIFQQANRGAFDPTGVVAARNVARWDGSAWSNLATANGQGVLGDVNALTVAHDRLYIGGTFRAVNVGASNGTLIPAYGIVAWDGDGWRIVGHDGGNGTSDMVFSLAAHDGQLYVGGMFHQVNVRSSGLGSPASYVARWDGQRWSTLGHGVARGQFRFVYSLLAPDAETLWVGGNFGAAGGKAANHVSRYATRGRLDVTTSGDGAGQVIGPGGIDCPAVCSTLLPWDTSVTLLAEPAIDSALVAWSGDCSGSGECVLAFDSARSVDARFDVRTFTLDYVAGEHGSIDGETSQVVRYGDDGSAVTAVPAVGHHFVDWSDGSTANPRVDGTVTADLLVTARFAINLYDVAATVAGNGSVTPLLQSIEHGASATLGVVAAAHHHVVAVDGDTCTPADNGNGTWTASNVTAACTIVASFAIDTFPVTAAANGEGSITPTSQTIDHAGTATFVVAASANHHLVAVGGDTCTPVDNGGGQWSSTITSACAVTATFAIDTYAISTAVAGSGTLLPAAGTPFPIEAVPHGSTVAFDVTPDAGHRLVDVTGCGASISSGAVFTTAEITAGCRIDATFNQNPIALDGVLTLDEDASATAGQLFAEDDDTTLTFELLGSGALGTAVLLDATTGSYSYTPHADDNGIETLRFRVSDGGAHAGEANIVVTIAAINDAPSVSIDGDISHDAASSGEHVVAAFAQFVAGPANESAQQVDAYLATVLADDNGVLVEDSLHVAADGTLSYTLTGTGGVASIEVRVRDDGGTANGGVDTSAPVPFTLTVAPSADLQLHKDDGRGSAQVGETLVYAITVANAGPNDAHGVVLQDVPPAELHDVVWACIAGESTAACPSAPGDAGADALSSTFDLPTGTYLRFDLAGVVQGATGGSVVNTATVTAPDGLVDPMPGDETSTDSTLIVPEGIFGDGFEAQGRLLRMPAARQAHEQALRDRTGR